MVHETRIGKATIVRNLVLAVGFVGMAVAGCGFNAARDGVSPQASVSAIDVPALKEAAFSRDSMGSMTKISQTSRRALYRRARQGVARLLRVSASRAKLQRCSG